jgi:hypothetical protein
VGEVSSSERLGAEIGGVEAQLRQAAQLKAELVAARRARERLKGALNAVGGGEGAAAVEAQLLLVMARVAAAEERWAACVPDVQTAAARLVVLARDAQLSA